MGYLGRVTLRADQEPALVDLLRSIGRLRHDGHTILELATVEDSKSNGFAERAVRSVEEMVRTLKVDLERRLEARVPIDSPALPWLVEHAVDLVNKLQVGSDGRTAYERLKLKRYHGEMYRFCEPVLARVTGKPVGAGLSLSALSKQYGLANVSTQASTSSQGNPTGACSDVRRSSRVLQSLRWSC